MTETTYICNICRDRYNDSDNFDKLIFGLWFISGNKIEIRRCHDCHNHICYRCFKQLNELEIPEIKSQETNDKRVGIESHQGAKT